MISNKLVQTGVLMVSAFFLGVAFQQLISEKNLQLSFQKWKLAINFSPKKITAQTQENLQIDLVSLQEEVLPASGFVFSKIKWGDLGKKMVADGVLDERKLAQAVVGEDSLPPELKKYLDGSDQQIELSLQNAQFWVDVLWGLGLANKNDILEKGPMVSEGNTANFASTGGYTIGTKDPMKLYSKYNYIQLSAQQQGVVEEIASGIFRPCCGNSTAFPDCNHGMAALALIELMVSQNFSKDEIYQTVLKFNSYWFPQTYLDISYHFAKNNRDFNSVPAQEILSKTFSSSAGYGALKKQIGEVNWPVIKISGCGA